MTDRYYGTILKPVSDNDGIAFIKGMKAAVESNQKQTNFSEYGACFVLLRRRREADVEPASSELH